MSSTTQKYDYTYELLNAFDPQLHDAMVVPYFKSINQDYALSARELQAGLEPGGTLKMAVARDENQNIAGVAVMAVYNATADRPAMAYRVYEAPASGIAGGNKKAEIQKCLADHLVNSLPAETPVFAEVPVKGYEAANLYDYQPRGMRTVTQWAEKEGWRLTVQNRANPDAPLPYSLLEGFALAWGRLNNGKNNQATLAELDDPNGNDMGIGKYLGKMHGKCLGGDVPLEAANVTRTGESSPGHSQIR